MQELYVLYLQRNIFLPELLAGLDVHKTSWTVCIKTKELEHKRFNQKPPAKGLAGYLEKDFPGGTYYSAYEAGFCGFHARLESLKHHIHNIIVNAAGVRLPTKKRHTRITGMAFLAEIEGINRFPSTGRFAAHAGLAPACHSAGGHGLLAHAFFLHADIGFLKTDPGTILVKNAAAGIMPTWKTIVLANEGLKNIQWAAA